MQKNPTLKVIFIIILLLFTFFLALPILQILTNSFFDGGGFTFTYYASTFASKNFFGVVINSVKVSAAASFVAVFIAFIAAYAIHYTNLRNRLKGILETAITLPMLIPTITYGFAIIFSFGKQGLFTKMFGHQLFDIYGFGGLLAGYVIYTTPVAFVLISNTMKFVDKRMLIVSKTLGDNCLSTFWIGVVRPLCGTLIGAFVQAFFLSFTDFGIPASIGGKYDVIATMLYNEMLGGIPDFNRGSVVAMLMMAPSVISIATQWLLNKYNFQYDHIDALKPEKGLLRDWCFGGTASFITMLMLSVFVCIFVIPAVRDWPYLPSPTWEHFESVFADSRLVTIYLHSVLVAVMTSILGTIVAYGSALVTVRSKMPPICKKIIDSIAMVTNTIPGMVIGVAYMFNFSGTCLQNTFLLMIICNVIHYFSSPYLMAKNSLSKMNSGWETTGMLMGDSWAKTILRVVTPNAMPCLLNVFSYYFVNSMVTISAIIFIVGSKTMVLTAKIKQLQYVNHTNEVFVLSLLILATNLIAKALLSWLANKIHKNELKGEKNYEN